MSSQDANWVPIGPYQDSNLTFDGHPVVSGAGRIDGIDISPDYDGAGHPAMYLAMPGGGVWRSSDFMSAAPTWSPLTDHISGIPDARRVELNNVSMLAVDPKHPQTIYARAGGEPPAILKTTDGGASWTLIGEGRFGGADGIRRVLADPLGTVYVAFNAGGFWQSTDGGATWTNVASTALDGVEFHDAVYFIDQNDQINIYVGVVDRQGRNRSGLWSFIVGIWRQMPITMTNMRGQTFTPAVINHITMSVDPTAGVCASLSQPDDGVNQVGLLNVFKLFQGTWQPQWFSNTDWFITQGGYVQGVCIAPDGRLYAGGIGLAQSAGGRSFVGIGTDSQGKSIHTDEHVIVAYRGQIYVGTDGGLTRFTPRPEQPGVVTWESLNTPSLTNFLSTGASAHPTDPNIFLVGNQDTGIARRGPNGQWNYSNFSNEREKLRFDPDPANQGRFAFSGDPGNGFYMSQDGGVSFQGFVPPALQALPPAVWAPDPPPPFSFHPKSSARIMIGWTTVYETPDRGITWNKKLTLQTAPSALTYAGDHAAYIGAGRQLFETHDDGQNWSVVNFDFGSSVVSLCADVANPDAIYVATPRRVLRRLRPQEAWEDLSGNLALAITAMALLPDRTGTDPYLFIGTGAGVFFAPILNGGNTVWTRFGTGLPDAGADGKTVTDLEITASRRFLLAATWGRGAWGASISVINRSGSLWHTVQTTPNESFGVWSQLGNAAGLGQIAVISTHSGSLEVFAVDRDAGLDDLPGRPQRQL